MQLMRIYQKVRDPCLVEKYLGNIFGSRRPKVHQGSTKMATSVVSERKASSYLNKEHSDPRRTVVVRRVHPDEADQVEDVAQFGC